MTKVLTEFKLNIITIALTLLLIASSIVNYFFSQDMQNSYHLKDELIYNGNRFMVASRYLTNEVRAYSSTGNQVHYDNYWNEVNNLKNREFAIEEIAMIGITHEELNVIEKMADLSNTLIILETEAMEHVKADDFKSAVAIVYGEDYNSQVAEINALSQEFIKMLQLRAGDKLTSSENSSDVLQILICVYTLIIFVMQVVSFLKNRALRCETDLFSGLYNRNKFTQLFQQITDKKTSNVGIVHLDINGLSRINTEYGYEYGDKLILKIVSIMKDCFEENIFRSGGDDFTILVVDQDRHQFDERVSKLRAVLDMYSDVDVSIGSVWCIESDDLQMQLTHAQELMTVDKQKYYTTHENSKKGYRAITGMELQNAINENEFVVVLQPKNRLLDKKVVGAEALVRKKDGNNGFIPPFKFISVYESDGVIALLDFHVLESVCKILKEWKDNGYPLIPISVNFSRKTILEFEVAQKINTVCETYNIDPKFITIELTESISNISYESLKEILDSIKSFGFEISLDDFGREYANLSIISNIEFNEIKIDKSIIDDLAEKPAIKTTIRCISEMCNAFRPTKMVIEGVETQEQIEELQALNSNSLVVQGYYFSKPIPVDEFLQYYLNRNAEN